MILNSTVEETPYVFTIVPCPLETQHHALTYISIIDPLKEKINIDLTKDGIFRSHPIGKHNNNGNIQIIFKFKKWKIKTKVNEGCS